MHPNCLGLTIIWRRTNERNGHYEHMMCYDYDDMNAKLTTPVRPSLYVHRSIMPTSKWHRLHECPNDDYVWLTCPWEYWISQIKYFYSTVFAFYYVCTLNLFMLFYVLRSTLSLFSLKTFSPSLNLVLVTLQYFGKKTNVFYYTRRLRQWYISLLTHFSIFQISQLL